MNNALIRSLLFWILFDVLLFGLGTLSALAPPFWSRLLQALSAILAAFFLIWIFLKNEKRTYRNIELVWNKGTILRFLMGVLIGTALLALILFLLISLTDIQFKRSLNPIALQTWLRHLIIIIPFAFMEELVFRSYAFLKLNKAYGLLRAQIITAIVFALYHVVGGWSWQVSFLGPFVWAFVFGLAAALPTGIHVALNFLQILTGMKKDKASLWILDLKKGHVINAEAFANKVGIFLQVFILIVALLTTWLYVRRTRQENFL